VFLLRLRKTGLKQTLRFFVNPPAMSNDKTYMMMVNSSEPYTVKIPGFKGLVSHLFIPDETFWRNKLVFNFLPQNISVISVEYHKNPDKSFKIKNFNDGSFALSDVNNNPEQSFNVEKVARYFTYFQNIQFEDVISGWTKEKVDSILTSEPHIQITVEDINGIKNNIKIFQKKSENRIDGFGEKTEFDLNRAYALLNNNHELLLIQYYVFDPLLKEIDYFR